MAKFVVNIEGMSNSPPYRIGELYLNVQVPETYVFTSDDFEVNTIPQYADVENDSILKIKIVRINIKNQGSITVNDIVVEEGDEILMSDIINGSMIYTSNPTQSEIGTDYFYFDVADTGSQQYGNIMGSIIINVLIVENKPPNEVGDGEEDVEYGETLVFTVDMFTTETDPPYSDPEGDEPEKLRIDTLPDSGRLEFKGFPVDAGDIIDFSDIADGHLIYYSYIDVELTEGAIVEFEFSISDKGSGKFSS